MSDTISRAKAIAVVRKNHYRLQGKGMTEEVLVADLEALPSAEIVRCKDCKKHNKAVNFDVLYKEDACPLISWRGKAQGHEFDYQYCPYGERK